MEWLRLFPEWQAQQPKSYDKLESYLACWIFYNQPIYYKNPKYEKWEICHELSCVFCSFYKSLEPSEKSSPNSYLKCNKSNLEDLS